MVTIKLKFRPMDTKKHFGQIDIAISNGCVTRQIVTPHCVRSSEFDRKRCRLIVPADVRRRAEIVSMRDELDHNLARLRRIASRLEDEGRYCSPDDVADEYMAFMTRYSLFNFMAGLIENKRLCGHERTSETYRVTLTSFRRFRKGVDMMVDALTDSIVVSYEAYLRQRGLSPNTSSFYLRILRAVYNKAVDCGAAVQEFPFRHVYTGIEKTSKRALPLKEIRRMLSLDLSGHRALEYARDIFILSFYTRGMSLVDLAFLRKSDLSDGYITYRRRKTGQRLSVAWTPEMQRIVDKYKPLPGPYLFPILSVKMKNPRAGYRNASCRINSSLKKIAEMIGYEGPLTLYCARHSWASVAQTKKIPISVISAGMGHTSEMTTRIYLSTIDRSIVDRANSIILKALH